MCDERRHPEQQARQTNTNTQTQPEKNKTSATTPKYVVDVGKTYPDPCDNELTL